MYIWLASRQGKVDYDEYLDMIIQAPTIGEAGKLLKHKITGGEKPRPYEMYYKDYVISMIGTAIGTESKVILTDFKGM